MKNPDLAPGLREAIKMATKKMKAAARGFMPFEAAILENFRGDLRARLRALTKKAK